MPPRIAATVIEEWNEVFELSVKAETTPPVLAARNLALLHGAMHDAVFLGHGNVRPVFAGTQSVGRPAEYLPAAAAAAAGHEICTRLFPGQIAAFNGRIAEQVTTWAGATAYQRSLEAGRAIAAIALAARANDGSATTVHYVPREGAGQWRRTTNNRPPELPHWPHVQPHCLASAGQFRPPPPPPPDSPEFAAALEEVKRLGARSGFTRTDEQGEIAVFWSDFSYTSTPPGHWNRVTRHLSAERGLPIETSARLFAVLNLALADAGLAAWECKYHYNYWRPATALRHAGHRDWRPHLPNPSHPEYPSGHSAFSGAAAAVLGAFFPETNIQVHVTSDALPGVTRRFNSFKEFAEEVSRSRVYAGIHYSFSGEQGLELGRRVAACVVAEHPVRVGLETALHRDSLPTRPARARPVVLRHEQSGDSD